MGNNMSGNGQYTGPIIKRRRRDSAGLWERSFTEQEYAGPADDPILTTGLATIDPVSGFANSLHVPHDHVVIGNGTTGIPSTTHRSNVTAPANPIDSCTYRISIDPTSNPEPFVQGLVVDSTSTHPGTFNIPLTISPLGLGLAETYLYDPTGFLSVGADTITVLKSCVVYASVSLGILSNEVTPNNFFNAQLLHNGQAVFTAPPGMQAGGAFGVNLTPTPVGGLYNRGGFDCGSGILTLTQGDVLALVFYLQYDSCVITLTSAISITMLTQTTVNGVPIPGPPGSNGVDGLNGSNGSDGAQGIQGIQGIQGVPGSGFTSQHFHGSLSNTIPNVSGDGQNTGAWYYIPFDVATLTGTITHPSNTEFVVVTPGIYTFNMFITFSNVLGANCFCLALLECNENVIPVNQNLKSLETGAGIPGQMSVSAGYTTSVTIPANTTIKLRIKVSNQTGGDTIGIIGGGVGLTSLCGYRVA